MPVAPSTTQPSSPAVGRGRAGDLPWGGATTLESGERVVASCRFDLDAALRFTDGWIVLTDRRLIADHPAFAADAATGSPRSWHLAAGDRLDVHLRTAVGRIELSRGGAVVARGLVTPARAEAVHAVEDAFDARVHGAAAPASGRPREAATQPI